MDAPGEAMPSHGYLAVGQGALHSPNPTADAILWIIASLAVVLLFVTVTDLFLRGRWRAFSLALASMLTAVAPLLGLYAAGDVVVTAALRSTDRDAISTMSLAIVVTKAGLSVCIGAAVGVCAAVFAAVLKLVPVRQPRSTNP